MRNLEVSILDHVLDRIGVADLNSLEQLMNKVLPQELAVVNVPVWLEERVVDGGIDERSFVAVRSKHDRHLQRINFYPEVFVCCLDFYWNSQGHF